MTCDLCEVAKRWPEIKRRLDGILKELNVEPIEFWLWKSRAVGTNRPDSDMDVFIQVPERYSEIVKNLDTINSRLRASKEGQGIDGIDLDARLGIGEPPLYHGKKALKIRDLVGKGL